MAFTIPDSTLEEIKARIDLGDLVSSYGIQVRHAGSSLVACCPFHHEKTPSFHINRSRGFYHCFGCGESGDAIKFVMKQEGLPFIDAVKKLADQCSIKIEERADPEAEQRKRLYALLSELAQFYRRCLKQMKAAQPARDYLVKRDLDEKAQEDFIIGFAPEGVEPMLTWAGKHGYTVKEMEAAGVIKPPDPSRPGDRGYHRFSGRLMFSIRDRMGRVVGFSGRQLVERKNSGKYVNSPETIVFRKSQVLFGFDKAAGNIAKAPHREVIVCEGQIDCIRLHISGFPVAVASQGTAFTEEHVKMLSRVADAAALCFDDDAAGHKAAIRSAGMLLSAGIPVRVVHLPDGDDPDSFLRTKGPEAFAKLLDDAESVVSFQCRVEKAKEKNPGSLDAVSRITKAVLGTISNCSSEVLKASMVAEAATLLALPAAALSDELKRMGSRAASPRVQPKQQTAPVEDEYYMPDVPPEDFADVDEVSDEDFNVAPTLPPPPGEMAFMAFLADNADDSALKALAAELLPGDVFSNDFTRAFVQAWCGREDDFDLFCSKCEGAAAGFLNKVLLESGKAQASQLAPEEVMRQMVRTLWAKRLKAIRGETPAAAQDEETVSLRSRLLSAARRVMLAPWEEFVPMIDNFKKGEY